MSQVDIHFDLETGSLHQDAAIFSIGAVAVLNGEIIADFHVRIDPNCYENKGRRFDNEDWWFQNNGQEYYEISTSTITLGDALYQFNEWLDNLSFEQEFRFWQKRMMDILWLESAAETCSQRNPIPFTSVYELTTWLLAKNYVEYEANQNAHNALADAEAQAMSWIRANLQEEVTVA